MAKSKKVISYDSNTRVGVNLGTLMFVIIFVYMCYNVYSYVTTTATSIYEVQYGELTHDTTYTGLILRSEAVYSAAGDGYINYFRRDASRVGANSIIYTLDSNGDIADKLAKADSDAKLINSDTLKIVEGQVNQYMTTYDNMNFHDVYTLKNNVNSQVQENISLLALESLNQYTTYAEQNNSFNKYYPEQSGVITYYTDGFENVTVDNFTSDMFDVSKYSKKNLRSLDKVTAGTPIYKLLTDDNWNVVVPADDELVAQLAEESVVKIKFLKDKTSLWAGCSIIDRDGGKYLVLSMKSAMVRFTEDRYLDFELVSNKLSGLKIPNSTIVDKDFYIVPSEYFYKNDDEQLGIDVEHIDEKGNVSVNFIETDIVYSEDDTYYIDPENVSPGDVAIFSDNRFVLKKNGSLKGVYSVNNGYAIFRLIDILYQNEEYTIIKENTSRGIVLYDHIALDGTAISDGDMLN